MLSDISAPSNDLIDRVISIIMKRCWSPKVHLQKENSIIQVCYCWTVVIFRTMPTFLFDVIIYFYHRVLNINISLIQNIFSFFFSDG